VNEAAIRLLARHGTEVVVPQVRACCGALSYHLGETDRALVEARRTLAAWKAASSEGAVDAVVSLASGCGLMLKDYRRSFPRGDTDAEAAKSFASSVRDISEVLAEIDLAPTAPRPLPTVAYQAPCSLEHGQRIRAEPREILRRAGFKLRELAESQLCCGSAGTYSLLQPDLSMRLKERKHAAIRAAGPNLVATANIGCQTHLDDPDGIPVLHLVELVDWATGGPLPARLQRSLPADQNRN
jgi:glycolate oxidase iron-sulfur subunit